MERGRTTSWHIASASTSGDLTTCTVCGKTLDNPRLLPCVHSFCLECIQACCKDKRPSDDVPCPDPECRKTFQIPSNGLCGLPCNFFLQGLIAEKKTTSPSSTKESQEPCEVCHKEKVRSRKKPVSRATNYCVDCKLKLCERCSTPHRKWKGGGHDVKELGPQLEQALVKVRGGYCDKHPDQRVELYCFGCQENICLMCYAAKHSDHKRGEIPELAADLKSQINSNNQQIASHISKIQQKDQEVCDEKSRFTSSFEKAEADIKEAGEKAKKMIDGQVRERVKKLKSVKEDELKKAATVEDKLQFERKAAETFQTYLRELLEKGRHSDVTANAALLHARAEELLQHDVTSLSYSAHHVTFAPADLKKLSNVEFVGQLKVFKGGQVIHTLPEGEPVFGVTSVQEKVYVLRRKTKSEVEVYDNITYSLLDCLPVPNLQAYTDMTSCEHFKCLYIPDRVAECVHRLDVGLLGEVIAWPVNDKPEGISINAAHNVLVTCDKARKIKEFSSGGDPLRDLSLPDDVRNPWHTIQLSSKEFIVCHGDLEDEVHRVCKITSDVRHIVHLLGGLKGSGSSQFNVPIRLAVDNDQFVFVVDINNHRVTLLSPTLSFVACVASRHQFKWRPMTLCLDTDRRRLYVADNECKDGKWTTGRVVVFNIQ